MLMLCYEGFLVEEHNELCNLVTAIRQKSERTREVERRGEERRKKKRSGEERR